MSDSDVSAPTHMITTMPPSDEKVNIVDAERASSPSPSLSYSDSGSSVSSTSDGITSKAWTPAGVYVPVHRRVRLGSDTSATSVNSDANTTNDKRANSASRPGIQVYSRAELLALAPSSLIHACLHPVVTPALIVKHPRILRVRGDGIARALDMVRNGNAPTPPSSYANTNVTTSLRLYASANMNATSAGLRDAMPRSGRSSYFASSEATAKAQVRIERGSGPKTPMQVQSPAPSLSTCPSGETGLDNININSINGSSPRRRRRRAAYQRNPAQHQQLLAHTHLPPYFSMRSEIEDAKLGLESRSTGHSVAMATSIPSAAALAAGAETQDERGTALQTQIQSQMNISTNTLRATTPAPIPRTTRSRHNKRRLDDVTVLNSWRARPTAVAA